MKYAFYVLILFSTVFTACDEDDPELSKIRPCYLHPDENLAHCYKKNGERKDQPLSKMKNYVCFSDEDSNIYLRWQERHRH